MSSDRSVDHLFCTRPHCYLHRSYVRWPDLRTGFADSVNSMHKPISHAKHLLPLAKHQYRPQVCRPVKRASLVLLPNMSQKTTLKNPIAIVGDNQLVCLVP